MLGFDSLDAAKRFYTSPPATNGCARTTNGPERDYRKSLPVST